MTRATRQPPARRTPAFGRAQAGCVLVGVVAAVVTVVLALALALAHTGEARAEQSATKSAIIDARTAHAKATARELVLVDIRTPEEWRETGVPASAWAVPLEQKPQALVAALTKLVDGDKTKPLGLICATGGRSSYLAGQLRRIGFSNVMDVSEGVLGNRGGRGWVKAGLPVRPGAEAANPPRLDAPQQPTAPATTSPQTTSPQTTAPQTTAPQTTGSRP